MDPERWKQIDHVLQAAQELDGDERRRFLDVACAKDEELRREIESLLAASPRNGDDLSLPAMEVVARRMADEMAGRETAMGKDRPLPSNAPTLIANRQVGNQPPLQFAAGEMLNDRYLIERELGRGGIGVVFLAQDRKLYDMQVVIKVLLEQWLKSDHRPWLERKFQDEMRALALINHHGVVPVHDVGELPDGRSFLVMKYVPGEPLSKSISPGGIPLKRAANLIHQIAHALTAAHEKHVIHRDLKPDNILLQNVDGEERIKLIDFGIATVRDAINTASTATKTLAGTPRYMAPEQLEGKPEKASDIYALGVIAYQLVTGQLPFNSKSPTEIAAEQHAGIKALPCQLRSDLPEAAEAAILKALALDPANRYQNAPEFSGQFQQAIEAVDSFQTNVGVLPQEEKPVQPMPVTDAPLTQRFPSRRRFLIPAAALLVAMMASLLAWQNLRPVNPDALIPTSPSPTPALPAVAERALSYSLLAKKNPKRNPGSQPFAPLDKTVFEAGDLMRLTLSSPQPGYLYLISEERTRANQQPVFVALFPNAKDNRGSARINANQAVQLPPGDDWWDFSAGQAEEKLWLVWAEQGVPELDANPKDIGELSRRHSDALRQFLDAHSITELKIAPDEAHPQLKLTGKETVLVGLLKLAR